MVGGVVLINVTSVEFGSVNNMLSVCQFLFLGEMSVILNTIMTSWLFLEQILKCTLQCFGCNLTWCCDDRKTAGNHRAHNSALSCRDAGVDRLMLVLLCCCCLTLTQAWSRVPVYIISNRHGLLLLNLYTPKRITTVISLLHVLPPLLLAFSVSSSSSVLL